METTPDENTLIEEIHRLGREIGKVPTYTDMQEQGRYSPKTYYEYFESWPAVIEAAGIDVEGRLVDELRRVSEEIDGQPTTTQMDSLGRYNTSRYHTYFDTWTDALEAAGVTPTSEEELLDDLRRLRSELGKIPNGNELNDRGRYTQREYVQTFGSLTAAIEEAGIDYEQDVLDELKRVATHLGRPPKTKEFTANSEYSAGSVYKFYDSWQTALEAAGLGSQDAEERGSARSDDFKESIDPNELAEYYESLSNLRQVQHALYGDDPSGLLPDDDPMAVWSKLLNRALGEEGLTNWSLGYGPQQRDRNDFSMSTYRDAYGNGDRVIDFHNIDVVDVSDGISKLVQDSQSQQDYLPIPVAPVSGEPLPVVVEHQGQLERAQRLLKEFPEKPSATETIDTEEDDGQSEEDANREDRELNGAGDEAMNDLINVSGINEQSGHNLLEAGYDSVNELVEASVEDLVEVDGISRDRALRIKVDVGG